MKYVGKTRYSHMNLRQDEDKSIRITALCKNLDKRIKQNTLASDLSSDKVIRVLNNWGLNNNTPSYNRQFVWLQRQNTLLPYAPWLLKSLHCTVPLSTYSQLSHKWTPLGIEKMCPLLELPTYENYSHTWAPKKNRVGVCLRESNLAGVYYVLLGGHK